MESQITQENYGTDCMNCERYKKLGDVCVVEHGKKFLWEFCKDFEAEVLLPDYKELMSTVRKDLAAEKKKIQQKKKRERALRKKELKQKISQVRADETPNKTNLKRSVKTITKRDSSVPQKQLLTDNFVKSGKSSSTSRAGGEKPAVRASKESPARQSKDAPRKLDKKAKTKEKPQKSNQTVGPARAVKNIQAKTPSTASSASATA
jgi:hypothetical protein